jgi:hypothetical protein
LLTRTIGGLFIGLLITFDPFWVAYGFIISLILSLFTGFQFQKQQKDPQASAFRLPIGKTLLPILAALSIMLIILNRRALLGVTEIAVLIIFSFLLWLPFGILMELRDNKRTVWNDIQTVEVLTWSWQRARRTIWRGLTIGIVGSLAMGILLAAATAAQTNVNAFNTIWQLVFLFGVPMGLSVGLLTGFSRDVIPMKTSPDQGFRLTLRLILGGAAIGAASIGLLAGGVLLALAPATVFSSEIWRGILFGASLGLRFGLLVGLWYGGLDLIYHFVLRLMLLVKHNLPLRLIAFLDEAAKHLYLRKVGGGYIYAHKLLQDYFANL